jgi:1,4-dihydroxy-2-naphthoate polyprenyltransferase
MPVFMFALSQCQSINLFAAVLVFLILHLFIYPASNGYNSYMDQDETSIGGLENPPKPTKELFYISMAFDIIGLLLALLVSQTFFIAVLTYTLVSRAYSFKGIRLKKYPILGFLTVIFFQGGFTFWMVQTGVNQFPFEFNTVTLLALFGSSFLIAGVYPLTQVYQHEADVKSGDYTISYRLGIRGTFYFTACMFLLANVCLYFYFKELGNTEHFLVFQLFLLPVVIYFVTWFLKVFKDAKEASFKNTMTMNLIASLCMNFCFFTLTWFNQNL